MTMTERIDLLVVGGGQAGLTAGYYLARSNVPFLILDANPRVGDSWRRRWDSLELFTVARLQRAAGAALPRRS
jgi:putative flavoprotein involved in K+ transport